MTWKTHNLLQSLEIVDFDGIVSAASHNFIVIILEAVDAYSVTFDDLASWQRDTRIEPSCLITCLATPCVMSISDPLKNTDRK